MIDSTLWCERVACSSCDNGGSGKDAAICGSRSGSGQPLEFDRVSVSRLNSWRNAK